MAKSKDVKGKFGLLYIEDGKAFPAYFKTKKHREMLNNLVHMGFLGKEVAIDKEQQLGEVEETKENN